MLTLPDTLTLGGEIQYIFNLLSLIIENPVPTVITVARIGGTVTVIQSKKFKTKSLSSYSSSLRAYIALQYPIIAKKKNMRM